MLISLNLFSFSFYGVTFGTPHQTDRYFALFSFSTDSGRSSYPLLPAILYPIDHRPGGTLDNSIFQVVIKQ
jgi:hypothetical protein